MIENPSYVADGMVNGESIATGCRVSQRSPCSLEIEWLLYPDVLEDCPDRYKWHYNNPPRKDHRIELGPFEIDVIAEQRSMRVTCSPSGTEVTLKSVELSREDGTAQLTIAGQKGTRFYGLGEQFQSVEHGGREIVCASSDWWNKRWFDPPAEKHSYAPVPFLLTSAGYGLVVLNDCRTAFDLRDTNNAVCSDYRIWVETAGVRLILIYGENPKAIISEYLRIQGRPYIPPQWALEPLLGVACNHRERAWNPKWQGELINSLREHDIPNGLVLDEAWNWTRRDPDSPSGHAFRPDCYGDFWPDNFSDPREAIKKTRQEAHSRTVFIIGPFVGCRCKYLDMLKSRGWLVRRASNPNLFLMGQYNHYFLDFTNPEAKHWWQQKLDEIAALGISGFFCDFGEADEQMDALYFSGGTGRSMGQTYNMLYKQAVKEILEQRFGADNYYLISRSGWTGIQNISGILQGDQQTTWEGLRQALTGLLSNSYSGQSVMAHNLGGYSGDQFPELYLRWVGLGVFSPLFAIWSDGEPGGLPWRFDDPAVIRAYRNLVRMRMRLLPYLYRELQRYRDECIPLIRPMWLEEPEDTAVVGIHDQFFCGSDLLVAPILNAGGERSLYLPRGRWRHLWTNEEFEGGQRVRVEEPLDQVPAFVREGALLPE